MYKEIAINPECMAHIEYYFLLKRETGYEQGRYLVADTRQWADEAFSTVRDADIPTIKKKSIKNFLNKLKKNRTNEHFVYPVDRQAIKGVCWSDWWEHQCAHRGFAVTLSEQSVGGSTCHMEVIEGNEDWNLSPSILLRRDSIDIVDVIEPLLLMSKELMIVDQYFSFSSNSTLQELCRRLGRLGSLSTIHLVTSINTANPAGVYEREYGPLLPKDISMRVTEVPPKYFHDRYMMTDVGGIKAGYGFGDGPEKGAPSDMLSVSLMSFSEATFVRESLKSAIKSGTAVNVFP